MRSGSLFRIIFVFFIFFSHGCSRKINLPPGVIFLEPQEGELNLFTLTDYVFSITCADKDGVISSVKWLVNEEIFESFEPLTSYFTSSITLNFQEMKAGEKLTLLLEIEDNDGGKTLKKWDLKIFSPLYLSKLMMKEIASPDSPLSIHNQRTKIQFLLSLFQDSKLNNHLYRNRDYDSDGIDDYYFISVTGGITEGLFIIFEVLQEIESFEAIDHLKPFLPSYYLEPVPFRLSGIFPGSSCSILSNPLVIATMIEGYVENLKNSLERTLEYFENITAPGTAYTIKINGERKYHLSRNFSFFFKGLLDEGDIMFFSSILHFFLGAWDFLKSYSEDTVSGLLAYIFDPCYYSGPWADRRFTSFGELSYPENLSPARTHISQGFYFLSSFIDFIMNEENSSIYLTSLTDTVLNTPFAKMGKSLGITNFDWPVLREKLFEASLNVSGEGSTNIGEIFQIPLTLGGIYLNWNRILNGVQNLKEILPLYLSGEGWVDGEKGNSMLYDLPEPCLDINFDGDCTNENYLDANGDGSFTPGDVINESGWPGGMVDGIYEARGDFYGEREVPLFYDTGSDGLLPFNPDYSGPDDDGSEGNKIYDDGEFKAPGSFQSSPHQWPDISGTYWSGCTTCTGVDPDNGVMDYFYYFFPDPSFSMSVTAHPDFDPDSSGTLSNGDINAFLSSLREKLGKIWRFRNP